MLIDWDVKNIRWDDEVSRIKLPSEVNYQFGRVIVGLGAAALLKVDIKKLTPIPDGPKIFAANHPTTTDPGLLTLLSKEPMAILIAETLYKVPVLGKYLQNAGHITVIPGYGKQALERARDVLASGNNVGIFTEGSLSPEQGGFMPPRTGTARLALGTGTPIIPVGIHLDRSHVRFLRTQVDGKTEVSRWCVSGPYAMTVGDSMVFSGDVNNWPFVRSISDKIMNHIKVLSHQSEMRIAHSMPSTESPYGWLPNLWSQSFSD